MRKSILLILAIAILFVLSGCAPRQQFIWVSNTFSQEQFDKDKYQCQQDAAIYAQSMRVQNLENPDLVTTALIGDGYVFREQRFKQCMEVKGYTLQAQPQNQPVQYSPSLIERCGKLADAAPEGQWTKIYSDCIKKK